MNRSYEPGIIGSSPGARSDFLDRLDRATLDIIHRWHAALAERWGPCAEARLKRLAADRETGLDALSLLRRMLADGAQGEVEARRLALAAVRRPEQSLADLFVELTLLAEAVEQGLMTADLPRTDIAAVMVQVRDALNRLYADVLETTAVIYERAIETGGRGFCRIAESGLILFANPAMERLLGIAPVEGRRLTEFFDAAQGAYLLEVLQGLHGPEPGRRRLEVRRPDGSRVAVNGSLTPLRECETAAYAILDDISVIVGEEVRVFERSTLGVLKLDNCQNITYANPALTRIIGTEPARIIGEPVWTMIPDPDTRAAIRQKLLERFEGFSDEYRIKLTRLDDGRRVPVMVSAMPEMDSDNHVIGTLAIVRNLALDETAARIHRALESCRQVPVMLREVASAIRSPIPFDRLVVTLFSRDEARDVAHARVLFSLPEPEEGWVARWHHIPNAMLAWLKQPEPRLVGDIETFLSDPRMEGVIDTPDTRRFIEDGFKSSLSLSILRDGDLVAAISLISRRPSAFGEADAELLKALPLDRVVQTALFLQDRREDEFRYALLKRIASSDDVRGVAQAIVEALAHHYQWQNVSIFMVDEVRRQFRLKAQCAGPVNGYELPAHFGQDLDKGLLGYVLQTGNAVNIGNVRQDEKFGGVYQPASGDTGSELCLPVTIGRKIRWILNVEDRQTNAFSAAEQKRLAELFEEFQVFLRHLFTYYTLKEMMASASDLIVITDSQGAIVAINRAAEKLLGLSTMQTQGKSLRALIPDAGKADFVIERKRIAPTQVELVNPETGARARVLLTGRQLPEEFGRKVLFGQDLSVMERLQELEAMGGLFYEIASQTRAPLSILAVWLKRLRTDATEREVEILDKATRQLHKLEITYDRMLLYDDRTGLIPFTPAPLDMAQLLETALAEFTEAERQAISRDIPAALPRVRGDIYQLSFIVETILSFLLRFAPEDEPVGIALSAGSNGGVDMVIQGRLPAHDPAPRAEVELALGERIIRRFVDQHGGRYDPPKAGGEHACFHLWLPAAS